MAKDKEAYAAATLETLEPIRETIRRVCIQDQFKWDQSWKSVLSDVNQVRRGLLLPDVFQQTLKLNGISLTTKTFKAVVAQFQLPNGAVQAHHFLQWIDLSRPVDYVDPDLVFARLPQPFRRIMKILEMDVLDAAWEQIRTTSAKYKAESSAALSARSSRGNGVLTRSHLGGDDEGDDDGDLRKDDYDGAKKKCCQVFGKILVPFPIGGAAGDTTDTTTGGATVVVSMMKMHASKPFVVVLVAVAGDTVGTVDTNSPWSLQLVHTTTQTSVAAMTTALPSELQATGGMTEIVNASHLRSRPDEDGQPISSFVIAIHVRVVPTSTPDTPTPTSAASSAVLVYEFVVPQSGDSGSSELVGSVVFPEDSAESSVTAIEVSTCGTRLAVAKGNGEVHVYDIPLHTTTSSSTSTESASPPPLTLLATVEVTTTPVSAVYFLNAPITDMATLPTTSSSWTTVPYALAVVAGNAIAKFLLFSPQAAIAASQPPSISPPQAASVWPHLSPITCSSIDVTTQFITVGLADGAIIIWNLLEDRDHVMITPPSSSSSSAPRGAIDQAFFQDSRHVVALSHVTQQLSIYDISDRAWPSLIRIITPPPPLANQPVETATRFRSLVVAWLDIPVAMVEYSSGYALLYDLRNGDALGSVRISKEKLAFSSSCASALGTSALVVLPPASSSSPSAGSSTSHLAVFDWADLLKTFAPALMRVVVPGKQLEPAASIFKRAFLAYGDDSIMASKPVSVSSKASSLHSLLLATAGHSHHHTQASTHAAGGVHLHGLSGSNSSSSIVSKASLHSDPCSQTSLPVATPSQLPELRDTFSFPHKPTIAALYDQFCGEDDALVATASGGGGGSREDAKLTRRRNELLKILTAVW